MRIGNLRASANRPGQPTAMQGRRRQGALAALADAWRVQRSPADGGGHEHWAATGADKEPWCGRTCSRSGSGSRPGRRCLPGTGARGRSRYATKRAEPGSDSRQPATGSNCTNPISQPANMRPNRHLQCTPAIPQDGQPPKLRKSSSTGQRHNSKSLARTLGQVQQESTATGTRLRCRTHVRVGPCPRGRGRTDPRPRGRVPGR
jgi:hypothetical protein